MEYNLRYSTTFIFTTVFCIHTVEPLLNELDGSLKNRNSVKNKKVHFFTSKTRFIV